MANAMSLRVQNNRRLRFSNKKKRNLKPIWFILALFIISASGFTWAKQNSFKKGNEVQAEVKKVESIFKAETKKAPAVTVAATQSKIDAITSATRGTYGYYVIDLNGGEAFGKNEDKFFDAASSIKVPFAVYAYSKIDSGSLAPEKKWTYLASDYEEGTGSLIGNPVGTKFTIYEVVRLMITKSDNAAANMVIRYLGISNMQSYFAGLGFSGINIPRNEITPKTAATILSNLYQGKFMSASNAEVLLGHMKNSITPERIVAGVPAGVPVAHKIGTEVGALSDNAVVYHSEHPYVLVVYSDKAVGETEPSATIAAISKAVYEHFDSK
jgi:beta-lactamase class A